MQMPVNEAFATWHGCHESEKRQAVFTLPGILFQLKAKRSVNLLRRNLYRHRYSIACCKTTPFPRSNTLRQVNLEALEVVVANGLHAFAQAGQALLQIRDSQAFKVHCETFEEYLEKRWPQLTRRDAFRWISAARVRKLLDENEVPNRHFLQRESHYRHLATISDTETLLQVAAAAIEKAIESGAKKLTEH